MPMVPSHVEWNDLFLFSQVVEQGGFTAAADVLSVPKSKLSRRISHLETQLNTRLLHRTSRKIGLTDAGRALFTHCQNMLADAAAGLDAVHARQERPVGRVRISMPVELSETFAKKLLPRFLRTYPDIQLSIQAVNRTIDMLEENMDVVVRGVGVDNRLASSNLTQACICTAPWRMVASPAYLERAGPLGDLSDLSRVESLLYSPNVFGTACWRLMGEGAATRTIAAKVVLESDSLALLKQSAMDGLGVTALPLYCCEADIAGGRLVPVLSPWRPKAGHLVVLFPSRRGLATASRVLVDFLKDHLPAAVLGHV